MKQVTEQIELIVKKQQNVIQKMTESGFKVGKIYNKFLKNNYKKNLFLRNSKFFNPYNEQQEHWIEMNPALDGWFDSMEMYVESFLHVQHFFTEQFTEEQYHWINKMNDAQVRMAEVQIENFEYAWETLYAKWENVEGKSFERSRINTSNNYIKAFEPLLMENN